MNVLRYETKEGEFPFYTDKPIVFLAGPTVRGNQPHLTSWRFDAIAEFERQGFDGTLIVPEFTDKYESDKYRYDIPEWEFAGLKTADCIMFWIPRTRELIGLTTNWEHGYWVARDRDKVVYGRPDDAYRMTYLDIMWVADAKDYSSLKPEIVIYDHLTDTVSASIKKATNRFLYKDTTQFNIKERIKD